MPVINIWTLSRIVLFSVITLVIFLYYSCPQIFKIFLDLLIATPELFHGVCVQIVQSLNRYLSRSMCPDSPKVSIVSSRSTMELWINIWTLSKIVLINIWTLSKIVLFSFITLDLRIFKIFLEWLIATPESFQEVCVQIAQSFIVSSSFLKDQRNESNDIFVPIFLPLFSKLIRMMIYFEWNKL